MKPKINIDKAEEIVLSYLERIEEIEEKISAFITLLGEGALDRAKTIDRKKERGRLAGIPVAIKDNILTKGIRTTCASRILGTFALSSGYYDAYYLKAAKTRSLICKEFERAFKIVDFILTPTSPEPAFLIGEKEDPIAMYFSDVFTVTTNLAGIPAISIPVGLSQQKLPLGLQIMGNFFQESQLFKLAFLLEKKVKFRKSKLILHSEEE